MKSLIPVTDAWLDTQYRRISTATQTALGLALYAISLNAEQFSPLIALTAISSFQLAKYSGRQARRKNTFFKQWEGISTDRHEDNLYENMQPEKVEIEEEMSEPPTARVLNLSKLFAEKLQSTIILGSPRSGKGYAVAAALRKLPNDVQVWLIDPKDDKKERYYWSPIPEERRVHFDSSTEDEEEIVRLCEQLFNNYLRSETARKLLIIDEASPGLSTVSRKWFKSLMLKCARLASVGPSKGRFVWVLAQSSAVEDLGISNANKGGYRIVACSSAKTPQTWFDSISRSVKLAPPSAALIAASDYLQNDGLGWGVAAKIKLTPPVSTYENLHTPVSGPNARAPVAYAPPSWLTKELETDIFDAVGNGVSLSAALESHKCGGRRYAQTKEYFLSVYPELFS